MNGLTFFGLLLIAASALVRIGYSGPAGAHPQRLPRLYGWYPLAIGAAFVAVGLVVSLLP